MKILLKQVSKKFHGHWIFKQVDLTFSAPDCYALLGANGSGKSTLLRIIAGIQPPSKGMISWSVNNQSLTTNALFQQVAYCAPAMELVEEFTLTEFFEFHFGLKKLLSTLSPSDIPALIGLDKHKHQRISHFSSGMKQRVKLAQAIFADTPLLLLDEPCTNLDAAGVSQYQSWMKQFTNNRLVIVASNDEREYDFCNQVIEISKFK